MKEEIKNLITNLPNFSSAYLFGSRAKGTFKENSDYDICIVISDNDKTPVFKAITEYMLKNKEFIQPLVLTKEEFEEKIKQFQSDFMKKVAALEHIPSTEVLLKMELSSPTVVQTISVTYKNTHLITDKIYAGSFIWSVFHFPNGIGKEPRKIVDENFLAENTLDEVINKILNIVTLK